MSETMMLTIRHFSYQGEHFYRLLVGDRFIDLRSNNSEALNILADGKPLPDSFPRLAPGQTIYYLPFDHEVQLWQQRQFNVTRPCVWREGVVNPYKFDMPGRFDTMDELAEWWRRETGQEFDWEVLDAYYEQQFIKTEIAPHDLTPEIIELGEWEPCPEVAFHWSVNTPMAYKEPQEVQHLFPCRTSGSVIKDWLKTWLVNSAKELGVKVHYLDQSEGSVYFVDGTSIKTWQFFTDMSAANLNELADVVGRRFTEAKQYVLDRAATAKCPHCQGSGRRMNDAGKATLCAETVTAVRRLQNTRNRKLVDGAIRMIEQLGKA